jgi:hypothetical protein
MKRDLLVTWGPALAATFAVQVVLTVGLAGGSIAGFNVDDAMHAVAGAAVLHDLARADLRSLAVDIWDQGRWPPLGSLLQLPTLAVLGVTEAAHRMAILVLLLPAMAVLAAAAKLLTEDEEGAGPWACAIVAGLVLSSGIMRITSASVLYEMPGMALAIGAYVAAHLGWKSRKAGWFWAGSVLLAAAFFTKWQYGIVGTVALLAAGTVRKRRGEPGVAAADYLFVAPFVTLLIWFVSAYHVREFGLYMLWRPSEAGKLGVYLHRFAAEAMHGGWATRINVAATLAGLAMAAPLVLRTPLGVALATHVVLATLGSGTKDLSDRIALWIAMPAWVLAAAGWARVIAGTGTWARKAAGPVALGALIALGTAGMTARQVHRMQTAPPHGGDWFEPEARYVAETAPFGKRLATIGGWRRFVSPFHIQWHMLRRYWDKPFSLRKLEVAEAPAVDWEPWRIRWSDPWAVFALRRDAARPRRELVPPEYVAIMRLRGGTDPKSIARLTEFMRGIVRLKAMAAKDFPSGSRVEIYKCQAESQPRGAAPNPAGAAGPPRYARGRL